MKTLSVSTNTPEWLTARVRHFCASEAPAMASASKYMTRTELLKLKATGITPEIDAATQRRFDAGHEAEAAARPIAEGIIGEELYPVVGTLDVDGLPLLASFDGLTMCQDIVWEHKLLNADLYDSLTRGVIPDQYHYQLEQQLLVSGAEKALFMASAPDKEALHAWYTSNPELRAKLIQGWGQFATDLAEYIPTEVEIKPVANTVTALPAVSVQVSGAIAIRDNMPVFEVALRDFIENRLIRNPQNDQDFADLEAQIKALKTAETALDAAEAQMLSQVESVDAAKRMKDMLHKLTRDNRLMAEKLLAARKDAIRHEIVNDAGKELWKHCNGLNERIGRKLLPTQSADFAGVIKGKRSLESMNDAVSTELARAKIEANAMADRISINLSVINQHQDKAFLFSDIASLVLKNPDDLSAIVQNRIAEHQAIEAARIEAERQRIAIEERIKAEALAQAKADAEIAAARAKADAEAKARSDAEAAAFRARVDAEVEARGQAHALRVEAEARAQDDKVRLEAEVRDLVARASKQPELPATIEPVAIEKVAQKSKTRIALDSALDKLDDVQLHRILSFVKSRYSVEVAELELDIF